MPNNSIPKEGSVSTRNLFRSLSTTNLPRTRSVESIRSCSSLRSTNESPTRTRGHSPTPNESTTRTRSRSPATNENTPNGSNNLWVPVSPSTYSFEGLENVARENRRHRRERRAERQDHTNRLHRVLETVIARHDAWRDRGNPDDISSRLSSSTSSSSTRNNTSSSSSSMTSRHSSQSSNSSTRDRMIQASLLTAALDLEGETQNLYRHSQENPYFRARYNRRSNEEERGRQ